MKARRIDFLAVSLALAVLAGAASAAGQEKKGMDGSNWTTVIEGHVTNTGAPAVKR